MMTKLKESHCGARQEDDQRKKHRSQSLAEEHRVF